MRLISSSGLQLAGAWLLSVLLLSCSSSTENEGPPLTIAGASNLRFALEEITKDFTAQTGTPTELIFASSGKLTAQITAGAPYDVFLSADEQYPAALRAQNLTLGQPKVYAFGPLAIWTTTSGIPLAPDSLLLDRVRKIAIPNPATAPYGQAAVSFLKNAGLYERLAHKLVFGESVGQANQFVYTGTAEVGLTAAATVTAGEKTLRFKLLQAHPPVRQSGVILSRSQQPGAAGAFLAYLLSPPAQQTLQKFGYFTAE